MVFLVLSGRSRFVGCNALAYASPQLGGPDQNQKILLSKTGIIVFYEVLSVIDSIGFHPDEIHSGCALLVWRACFS
jgi:hypothetical protein